MRTIQKEVYTINELSEKAKEKAYYKWLENSGYGWADENINTLKEFENIFPIKVRDYQYGYHNYINFEFTEEEEFEKLSGIRLMKYIINNYGYALYKGKYFSLWSKTEKEEINTNMGKLKSRYSKVMFDNCCVLTGYYMDDVILSPIYEFLKSPKDDINFYDLMKECLDRWLEACDDDYTNSTSMEYFIEEAENNSSEYFEDGTLY